MSTNAGIAGGSDSYGYVSQADRWLDGSLRIEQAAARHAPWPMGQWTFAPLGYRPSVDGDGTVPVYAPGLAIIMALFKKVAGQCGIAWVIPLSGALLVAVTFGIGRRVHSGWVGLAAAWLVATSPVVLFMLQQPMSDIPVAACWGIAIYGCLMASRRGAVLAGLGAAVAILIRPNLVQVGLLMGLWLVVKDWRTRPLTAGAARTVLYGLPVAAACIGIALLNRHLYGSMTSSGYGPLEYIYSPFRGPTNFVLYSSWLLQTQTPLAALGLVGLFVPTFRSPRFTFAGKGLFAAVAAGVIGGYLFWIIFDSWWYLRFLLTCWPLMCVSAAWMLTRPQGRRFRVVAVALVLGAGGYGLWFSQRAGVFNSGEGDRRYVAVARLVRDATPPGSVIISLQHSGSVRFYGGRTTLRYDFLNQRWLDRAVEWLAMEGAHPYILLDEGELAAFTFRFGADNALAKLNVARVWEYHGSPNVFLFDPLQPERPGERPVVFSPGDVKIVGCPEAEPQPTLSFPR